MNLLYEQFPETLRVSGKEYPIYTDFRNWLRFFDMLEEKGLSEREKMLLALRWFKPSTFLNGGHCTGESQHDLQETNANRTEGAISPIPPNLWEEGLQALIRFAICGEIPEQSAKSGRNKKILSWSFDAPFVYAGFLSVYQIDLLTVQMHWHLFLALFDALPEDTPIKQRMYYRGVNIGEIKDKNEKKRILKIQRQIRIPQEKMNAFEIGNVFG